MGGFLNKDQENGAKLEIMKSANIARLVKGTLALNHPFLPWIMTWSDWLVDPTLFIAKQV